MLRDVDKMKTSIGRESFEFSDVIIVEKQLLKFLQSFEALNTRQLVAF